MKINQTPPPAGNNAPQEEVTPDQKEGTPAQKEEDTDKAGVKVIAKDVLETTSAVTGVASLVPSPAQAGLAAASLGTGVASQLIDIDPKDPKSATKKVCTAAIQAKAGSDKIKASTAAQQTLENTPKKA